MALSTRRDGWLMISPLTAFLLVVLAIPMAVDVVYAVSHVTFETLRAPRFIGLGNFAVVLRDTEFWGAMLFSLRFALLVTMAELLLGLALAIFLAPLLSRRPWLIAPLMLPMMVAPALVGLMYRLALHEFVGPVPYYFVLLTGDSPSFLGPGNVFWTLVTIETLQWTPFALLILYTAYQSIPSDVREAAELDGPCTLQLLRHIELPLMRPTILAVGFIRFIDSFRVFDNVYTLTGSGAGGNTRTISIYIYEAFFSSQRYRRGGRCLHRAARRFIRVADIRVALVGPASVRRIVAALRWLVLVVAVAALNAPVIITLITSFKSDAEIASNPSLVVSAPTFANYQHIFAMTDRFDIVHYLTNSVIEASLGTVFALALALPAAYGMVRFRTGLHWLFPQVVNQRAIPLIIFAIPLYLMYQATGLLDTRLGMAIIVCWVNLPLALVLLVNAVREVPIEMDEAARIDGAGSWTILRLVIMPLVRQTIASATVLAFVYAWNEFLFGLILTTRSAVPVTVGASFFFSASGGGVQWGVAAAVMVLSTLPPFLLGLFAYRHIGRSLTAGAIKG